MDNASIATFYLRIRLLLRLLLLCSLIDSL
jgi:hypothetical protein